MTVLNMLEINSYLFVPIIITMISGLFAVVAVVYSKLRRYIYVTVNCWFCNGYARVPLVNKNSFVCSLCRQYNGFTKDGDYNRDIPAQRMECLNIGNTFKRIKSPKLSTPTINGLCNTCNVNQSLKVKSLAEFEPFLEDNYDAEIEEYRQRLDRIFSMCRNCEGVLHQTIGKQNSWIKPLLISYRLMQSKKHIMEVMTSVKRASIVDIGLKFILLMTALYVLLSTLLSAVPDEFLLINYEPRLSSVYSFGKENLPIICFLYLSTITVWFISNGIQLIYAIDCVCLMLWGTMLGLSSGTFSIEEYFASSLQVLALITFFATALMVSKRRFVPSLKNSSANRIRMNEQDLSQYSYNSDDNQYPVTQPPSSFGADRNADNNCYKIHRTTEDYSDDMARKASEVTSRHDDLGSTFGGLKIGTPQKKNQQAFSAKSLFSDKYHHILAEPKLFSNATQASWVAGGYWGPTGSPQKGRSQQSIPTEITERRIPPFSFSRSSSQSSGFISQTSGTYNSLMDSGRASLCSDADRASQISESASMYPRLLSKDRFTAMPRISPTLCSASSCNFSQPDFRSPNASQCNSTIANFHDFSMPLNNSNKSNLNDNLVKGGNLYEDLYAKFCYPLVAFILGISVTANFFLYFNNRYK